MTIADDNHPELHIVIDDTDSAERDRLVYQYVIASIRYMSNGTGDNYAKRNTAFDALIAWDDTHPDTAGDEVKP